MMRKIQLTMQDSGSVWAGQKGDHRMAQLIIPLPEDVAKKVKSCVVIYSMDYAKTALSPLVTAGSDGDAYIRSGKVYIVLHQTQTLHGSLRVQLECYSDTKGECWICRSAKSEKIKFRPSLAGSLDELPEARADPGAISELISMIPGLRGLLAGGGGGDGGNDLERRVTEMENELNALAVVLGVEQTQQQN